MAATSERDIDTEVEKPADTDGSDEQAETPSAAGEESAQDSLDVDEQLDSIERSKPRLRALPWRRYSRRSILPLLLAASLAACGYLGWAQWQTHRLTEAGLQAQQAAVAYAQALTSIDSNNVDQNFRQVLDGATGEFKDMYTQSSVQLRQLLIENKATAHGVVVDSAVQSAAPNRVVVLLFIDQSVTNTQLPDPRMDRSRIKMTMERIDGRWLASKVQLL